MLEVRGPFEEREQHPDPSADGARRHIRRPNRGGASRSGGHR